MSRSRQTAGFTLIEMVVTMSIFAILVAVGVPTMRTWVANNKVRAVSDALQTGLRAAQAESLRTSRQVVFALTNSTTPTITPVAADPNGTSWAMFTVPSLTGEPINFIQSGILSNASATVQVNGVAAVCFNSMGRLIGNASANVTAITGGPTCAIAGQVFNISAPGSDRPLQVTLSLGGQVHMCMPGIALSLTHPEGC